MDGSGAVTAGGEESDWLRSWAEQHLAVTLTFVEGSTVMELVERFGTGPDADCRVLSLDEMDALGDMEWARVGDSDGWAFLIEHFTVHGTDEAFLRRVAAGARSVTVSYTQTISGFIYAESGEVIVSFEMDHPEFRHGARPSELDDLIAQAGWVTGASNSLLNSELLVRQLTGITIDEAMLEGPQLCCAIRPVPGVGSTGEVPFPPRGIPLETRPRNGGSPSRRS